MNIIDAIKSGKRFRRVDQDDGDSWMEVSKRPNGDTEFVQGIEEVFAALGPDSVLADWELEEEPEPTVTITRAQFWNAVNACSSSQLGAEIWLSWKAIEALAKKLGIE